MPNGVSIRSDDYVVKEPLDRGYEEAAYRDVEIPEPIVVTPLLALRVVVPDDLQFTAERPNRLQAVEISRRSEPVTVQFQVRDRSARPDLPKQRQSEPRASG